MRLKYLELVNYRRFHQCEVEFPDGVVGIVGPNGTGKSTLVEAISWALYGNESQIVRAGKESIRSADAAPNEECSVTLEFDMDGDEYRVLRSMRGRGLKTSASLWVNGRLEAEGDRGTAAAVTKHLGMDYKAFFVSVFARQKDLDALTSLQPAERRRLILRMLDIDLLDKVLTDISSDARGLNLEAKGLESALRDESGRSILDAAKEDLSAVRAGIGSIEASLQEAEGTLEDARAGEEAAKGTLVDLRAKEKGYRILQADLSGARSAVGVRRSDVDRLVSRIEDLQHRREGLESVREAHDEWEGLKGIVSDMEAQRVLDERRRGLLERRERLNADVWRHEEALESKRELASTMRSVEDSLETVDGSMGDVQTSRRASETELATARAELRSVEAAVVDAEKRIEEITRLGPVGSCPMCERPLEEHQPRLLERLREGLVPLRSRRDEAAAAVEMAMEVVERHVRREEALRARRDDLLEGTMRHREVLSEIRSLEATVADARGRVDGVDVELEGVGEVTFSERDYAQALRRSEELRGDAERFLSLSTEVSRLPEFAKELAQARRDVATHEATFDDLSARIDAIGFDPMELSAADAAYASAVELHRDRVKRSADLRGSLATAREREASLRSDVAMLEGLHSRVRELRRGGEELEVLKDVMSNLREDMVSRILPMLQDIASALFSEMTDSRYNGLRLDAGYEMSVLEGGVENPVGRYSGGERDLASLCLRLAISRIIADRSGRNVNFLILDEIFGSLDQDRKRSVLATLNHLSRHFRQILLITHVEDVKEMMGHVMVVSEDDHGGSVVSYEG